MTISIGVTGGQGLIGQGVEENFADDIVLRKLNNMVLSVKEFK